MIAEECLCPSLAFSFLSHTALSISWESLCGLVLLVLLWPWGPEERFFMFLELPLGSEVSSLSPLDITILLYTLHSVWEDCSVPRGLNATWWVHFLHKYNDVLYL